MAEDVTVEQLMSMNINHYFSVIAFTLLVLEYCDTFVQEVERFWKVGRLSWASGLFYLNRYMVLFGHIPVLIEYFWSTANTSKIQSYHQYFAVAIQIVVSSMLIMRMYALYERSKKVLALHIAVAVTAVAVGCWAILGGKTSKAPEIYIPVGCGTTLTHYQAVRLGAAWGGMLVFDALVFGMTLYKSISIPRTRGVSLITVLLRDGAVYFSIMMASNLGNILTFLFGGPFTRGVATTFTNIVSSIMISRLMLNLRHPSLVSHRKHTSITADDTYPNLTFVEPHNFETVYSNNSGFILEEEPGRARLVYDYLAKGSSGPNRDIELLDREHDGRHL